MSEVEGCKIVVMDRGFVVVGMVLKHPELAFHWRISPSRTVRRWGTTNGLAELANGPLANTILDPVCHRTVPFRAVLDILDAKEDKWRKHLNEK